MLGLLDTYFGLVVIFSCTAVPGSTFMMKGFFDTIPHSLEEAAMLDGASRFQCVTKIIMPLARPMIGLICLFGAELSYASQNVKKFSFERDSKNISRRYKDFLTLLITSLIVKRFERGDKPYTADELSDAYRIPIRITTQILYHLMELGIIIEVNYGDDDRVAYYQPAIDINQITVSYLFSRMDKYGSENFKIDTSQLFNKEWEVLLKTREDMVKANDHILLKDL